VAGGVVRTSDRRMMLSRVLAVVSEGGASSEASSWRRLE